MVANAAYANSTNEQTGTNMQTKIVTSVPTVLSRPDPSRPSVCPSNICHDSWHQESASTYSHTHSQKHTNTHKGCAQARARERTQAYRHTNAHAVRLVGADTSCHVASRHLQSVCHSDRCRNSFLLMERSGCGIQTLIRMERKVKPTDEPSDIKVRPATAKVRSPSRRLSPKPAKYASADPATHGTAYHEGLQTST